MAEVDICESLELDCAIFNQQAIPRTCNVQIDSESLKKIPESAKGIESQERRWKGHNKIFVLGIGSQLKDREQGTHKGQGGVSRTSS